MPAWDFRSSYGGLTSQAYRKARQRLEADIHILSGLVPNAKDAVSISIALEHLAEVFSLTDSLIGYCRCLSAIDTREQEAAKELGVSRDIVKRRKKKLFLKIQKFMRPKS